MGRIKRSLFALLVALCMLGKIHANAKVPEEVILKEEELYSKAAVLMDAKSKRVLFEKNADEALAMASTTKIMTCIITLECADVSEFVDISAYAQSSPKVKMGVKKGETYILEDLLYSMMLESNNDAAVAIAEHVGKKYLPELENKSEADFTKAESKQAVAAFCCLMNEKAKSLGCENTFFVTPNGLDETTIVTDELGMEYQKEHSSTAKDMALIMSYCVYDSPKKEEYLRITRTSNRYLSSQKGRGFTCSNLNAFLSMMDGALSGKTGFTNKAGYCYVGALERDGRTYVVALLACGWPNNKNYKWSDTKKLMNYGIENYVNFSFDKVLYSEDRLGEVGILGGKSEEIGKMVYIKPAILERTDGNGEEPSEILLRRSEKIDVVCTMKKYVTAPVYKGQEIGKISYKIGDVVYKEESIVLEQDVESIDILWCINMVFGIFQSFFVKRY